MWEAPQCADSGGPLAERPLPGLGIFWVLVALWCRTRIRKASQGRFLVVVDFKQTGQFGNDQDLLQGLGRIEQLHFTALPGDRSKGFDELSDSGTVDVLKMLSIQENVPDSVLEQFRDFQAQFGTSLREGEVAVYVYDRDVLDLPSCPDSYFALH